MKRPVRPVGEPASRNREGLTAASWRSERRIVEKSMAWIEVVRLRFVVVTFVRSGALN